MKFGLRNFNIKNKECLDGNYLHFYSVHKSLETLNSINNIFVEQLLMSWLFSLHFVNRLLSKNYYSLSYRLLGISSILK